MPTRTAPAVAFVTGAQPVAASTQQVAQAVEIPVIVQDGNDAPLMRHKYAWRDKRNSFAKSEPSNSSAATTSVAFGIHVAQMNGDSCDVEDVHDLMYIRHVHFLISKAMHVQMSEIKLVFADEVFQWDPGDWSGKSTNGSRTLGDIGIESGTWITAVRTSQPRVQFCMSRVGDMRNATWCDARLKGCCSEDGSVDLEVDLTNDGRPGLTSYQNNVDPICVRLVKEDTEAAVGGA